MQGLFAQHLAVDPDRRQLPEEKLDEAVSRKRLYDRQKEMVIDTADLTADVKDARVSDYAQPLDVRVERSKGAAVDVGYGKGPAWQSR